MRTATVRRFLAALALAALIAGPVLARPAGEPLAWVAVSDWPPPSFASVQPHPRSDVGTGVERVAATGRPSRPIVPVPSPRLVVTTGGSNQGQRQSGALVGQASWFCGHGSACTRGYVGGLYAAAGPLLRQGDWRGRLVNVRAGGRLVVVRLVDWCACPHRLLDLYSDAFLRLAPLSRGVLAVTVRWR